MGPSSPVPTRPLRAGAPESDPAPTTPADTDPDIGPAPSGDANPARDSGPKQSAYARPDS